MIKRIFPGIFQRIYQICTMVCQWSIYPSYAWEYKIKLFDVKWSTTIFSRFLSLSLSFSLPVEVMINLSNENEKRILKKWSEHVKKLCAQRYQTGATIPNKFMQLFVYTVSKYINCYLSGNSEYCAPLTRHFLSHSDENQFMKHLCMLHRTLLSC